MIVLTLMDKKKIQIYWGFVIMTVLRLKDPIPPFNVKKSHFKTIIFMVVTTQELLFFKI